jgi:hypothetical protein
MMAAALNKEIDMHMRHQTSPGRQRSHPAPSRGRLWSSFNLRTIYGNRDDVSDVQTPSNNPPDAGNAQGKSGDEIANHTCERAGHEKFDKRRCSDITPNQRNADDDGRMNDVDRISAAREVRPDTPELGKSPLEEGQQPKNEAPGKERLPARVGERLNIQAAFGWAMKP